MSEGSNGHPAKNNGVEHDNAPVRAKPGPSRTTAR